MTSEPGVLARYQALIDDGTLAPDPAQQPDEYHGLKVGRLRELEALGLADQVGPGQWVIGDGAEATLRATRKCWSSSGSREGLAEWGEPQQHF